MARASLGRRVFVWLLAYTALATALLFAAVAHVHEQAEHAVWDALLTTELDAVAARLRAGVDDRWQDSGTLRLFRGTRDVPEAVAALPPGLHDEIPVDGRASAVLVRDEPGVGRLALALDITDFEVLETVMTRWAVLGALVLIAATLVVASVASGRLFHPLRDLADDIAALQPEATRERVRVGPHGSSELFVIADALNGYLDRHARFVERERTFINTASHELRTPMAVIAGATELALQHPGMPEVARAQVLRAHRTVREVEQLISLLLVLAKDPARLARSSDRIALHELVPEIVADHQYLMAGKQLAIDCSELAPSEVLAPIAIVQVAIGNLLRNAIENSDQGTIRIRLEPDAVLSIEDPGHGMAPEEVARIYSQIARGTGRDGGGIGLELLARICEHLGWRLSMHSVPGRGTRAVLALGTQAEG